MAIRGRFYLSIVASSALNLTSHWGHSDNTKIKKRCIKVEQPDAIFRSQNDIDTEVTKFSLLCKNGIPKYEFT